MLCMQMCGKIIGRDRPVTAQESWLLLLHGRRGLRHRITDRVCLVSSWVCLFFFRVPVAPKGFRETKRTLKSPMFGGPTHGQESMVDCCCLRLLSTKSSHQDRQNVENDGEVLLNTVISFFFLRTSTICGSKGKPKGAPKPALGGPRLTEVDRTRTLAPGRTRIGFGRVAW